MKAGKNPEDWLGEYWLQKHLTMQLLERAMSAEMTKNLALENIVKK